VRNKLRHQVVEFHLGLSKALENRSYTIISVWRSNCWKDETYFIDRSPTDGRLQIEMSKHAKSQEG
jgi:hypothetical protein